MAINPYGLYQQEPFPEEPQGDKAATSESFQPTLSKNQLDRLIKTYKRAPRAINPQVKDKIKKHSIYYNVPFYEGDFNITEALKQFGVGLAEGFTTLGGDLVDHPDNEYEAIVRNVGHLIGFAPNLLAKPLKLLGLHNKAAAIAGVRSLPMLAADAVTKKAKSVIKPILGTAMAKRAGAAGTAANFLTSGAAKHVAEGAFHLGVASGVSNWKQGIDGMVQAGFGGAKFGGAFALLGNVIPGKGGGDYILRALAGSLFQGLPSTQRGATTPEQVYEYLLGAYFGGGAIGWKQKKTQEFFTKKEKQAYGTDDKKADTKLRATNDPELVKGWSELDPIIQKEVIKEMANPKSVHFDPDVETRTAIQESVIKELKLNLDEFGKPTEKSWESLVELSTPTSKKIGLATQTEKEFNELYEKRKNVVEEISELRKQVLNLEGPERIQTEDRISNLESEITRIQERETELMKLKPYEFIDRKTGEVIVEERLNDGHDIGMANKRDLYKKAQIFVEDNLTDVWDKPDFSPYRKRSEVARLTNLIDNIINKEEYSKKEQRVDTDALIKDIETTVENQEGLKIKVDKETKDSFRQFLTRKNFGQPVKYLNVSLEEKSNNLLRTELRGEDGLTLQGNRKISEEPKKRIQEVLEELGSREESHVILDNITAKGEKGYAEDFSLSNLRNKLRRELKDKAPKEYERIVGNIHKKMAEQDYYPFGGKGDNDVIIYVKKHPHMQNKLFKSHLNSYLNTYFAKNPKARRYFNEAIKRNKWFSSKEAKDQYLSNMFWDLSMNGFKPKTYKEFSQALDKMFTGDGYIKNATAWNKRQQIWFTPTWKADGEFVANHYDAYLKTLKDPGKFEASNEFIAGLSNGMPRYIIARDLDPSLFDKGKRINPLDKNSKNTEYGEHVDGMILVEDNYLNALIADSGLPSSGQSKSFIVSPDATNGALLGKYMMHSVGPKASKQMRKAGIHMIMQESAVKQRGERQVTDYDISKNKLEIENDAAIYELPIKDIKYGYNVKQNSEMAGYTIDANGKKRVHKHGIPKQLLMSMAQNTHKAFPIKMVEDFFNETVYKSFKGDADINLTFREYLENPKSTKLLSILEKNIDKLGMRELLEAINGEPTAFTDAAYMRLMKINRENIASKVAEGELEPDKAEEMIGNINEFNSATDRIIDAANNWSQAEKLAGRQGNINPVLLHKYIRPYRFQVIRNYVFHSISRPKIGNSGTARMRGYDKWFQADSKFKDLETRDDIFYLDNGFKEMPIKTHIKGFENTTLGKFWNAYSKKSGALYNNKDAKDVLTALTVRVPMDSVSGAQSMEFKGFTDRNGHGILMHSRAMRAEGGADLDGDESFIFFGGRKGNKGDGFRKEWTKKFHENKDEFIKKDGSIYDNKNEEITKKLTFQDSKKETGIDPEARDSKIWQYDSAWREELSERAVEGRRLLGGAATMTQILKAANNAIAKLPGGKNTFTVSIYNKAKKKYERVPITVAAKTAEKDLMNARELSSSMVAFTSDPLDVAGLTGYEDYFAKLHDAYFTVEVPKKYQKLWNNLTDAQKNSKLRNQDKGTYDLSVVGQLREMNSAMFSRDYANNESFDAQTIREMTRHVKNNKTFGEDISHTMLPKLAKLAHNVDLVDTPFKNIDVKSLNKMYAEHAQIIKAIPEMRDLLGNLKVPKNPLVEGVIKSRLYDNYKINEVAGDFDVWKKVVLSTGSPYAKGNAKDYIMKNMEGFEKSFNQRKQLLKNLVRFSEDILTNDVSDMVTFRQLYRYYDPVEIGPVVFKKILTEANRLRRNSYLQRKGIGEESFEELMPGFKVKKSDADGIRRIFGNIEGPKGREVSKILNQTEIDAKILEIKKALPNDRARKLFDMALLGTTRQDGTETSTSKLGFSSVNVDNASVSEFIGDYSTVMKKAYEKTENPIDKDIMETFNKGDMVEKDLPGKTILKDTTTGYEGLHGTPNMKKIPKEVRQELTELVENLKFYNGKIGQNLNEVVRGILGKDFNALTYKDFVDLNNYFKEVQRGSIWQRLFGDKTPTLKKRYTLLFPSSIGRETMKYDIELMKKRGLFVTKAGEVVEGDMQIPTNFSEKLQHAVAITMDKAQGKGDEEVGLLRKELEFIDAIQDGEGLRRVAVRKLEAEGNVSKRLSGDKALSKQRADNYKKEYENIIEEVDYNTLKDKKYIVTNKALKRVEMTGEQIVNQLEGIYKNHFKKMHKIMTGNQDFTDSYIKTYKGKKMYFDFMKSNPEEPIFDYKKIVKDIYKAYEKGEDITTEFGIDGLRQIARSMMVQLQHKFTKTSKGELRKKMPIPKLTGNIEEGYWPHMFFDKVLARNALKSALEKINESNMSEQDKAVERDRVQWRSKTLTGDWITGTENWDAYDVIANKLQKNTDKVSWFQANQMTSSMHQRTSHIPGWSIDATVPETYSRNVYKTYYKQLAQILSRDILQEFDNMAIKRKWHEVEFDPKTKQSLMTRWSNFYKLYVQDAMGHPSIIPDWMINDPGMKLKGTPYAWWADNKVRDRVNKIAKGLGLKGPVVDGVQKDRYSVQDMAHWSNLEAKYELMSLLAHPKSMINNLFGGTLHTVQSSGATTLKKARDYNFLRTINPEWTNNQAILDFVIKQGVFPEMLQHEWGLQRELQSANTKAFLKDAGKKLSKDGKISDKSWRELASEYKITAPILKTAAKFMSVPEMALRRDAFMTHYIKAWERFGGAITQFDHPFLVEQAKKGVKATQFLYSAPYRPGFARTALGKIMTRFQLWSWNSAKFRNDVIREARIKGYRAGTPEYEKFKRTAQIDMLTYALGSVFTMSLFENVLPAPLNHFKETSEWLFGDEDERNRAFFGAYPTKIAPLQMISPPISRVPLSILRTLTDDNYNKFFDYHIYTAFPFGRIARDFSPFAKGNVLDNPYRMIEKFTGFPYGDLQRKRKEIKKTEAYHPVYRSVVEG